MDGGTKEKSEELGRLRRTIARLREPNGCPWDMAQTHRSIRDCLIEECAELLDALDREDFDHMREELGDVLVNVMMQAQMAQEEGKFDIEDVAREVNEKLVRRHPHVFANGDAKTADEVLVKWDAIKKTERHNGPQGEPPFKYTPPTLSALLSARAVFKQIEKGNLPCAGVVDRQKIAAEAENLTEEKAGERLFEIAAACKLAGIDPEAALRGRIARVKAGVRRQVG